METFLVIAVTLLGLSVVYIAMRYYLIDMYFTYNHLAGKKVFRQTESIPKWTKFFLLGRKRYEQLLRIGEWYRIPGFHMRCRVCNITYIKWNRANILISFSGDSMDASTIRLTQEEIDSAVPTSRSNFYNEVMYAGELNGDMFRQPHMMPDGTIIDAPNYELAVQAYLKPKQPKKKYPQRRKHGVK